MKDKDIKFDQKLTDACSSLSFYTDNPYFVEPMDFNIIPKDYKQLKNDVDRPMHTRRTFKRCMEV